MSIRSDCSVLFIFILFFSCNLDKEPEAVIQDVLRVDSLAIKKRIQAEQDSTLTAFFLQQYIENLLIDGEGTLRGEQLFSDVMLPDLYEGHSYQLLWKDSLRVNKAIQVIQNVTDDGLNPLDYHLNSIIDLANQQSKEYDIRAALDILITDAIILYGTHLLNGRTDPRTLEPTLKYEQRVLSDAVLSELSMNLINDELEEVLHQLRPPSRYYSSMMEGLQFYESLVDSGGWQVVSLSVRKLEPGNSYADIESIRKRMLVERDLLSSPDESDTLFDPLFYDDALQGAVERFQERHGLNPDGVIGRGTVKAMNISANEKVNLLKANMERARWIHHDLDSNYVLVNIAGFDLRLVKGDTLCWSTKVMVGKLDTSTPVFRDEMQYIEVNPEWTVPFSISNDEILPKLKKDPSYLRRNNMELLTMAGNSISHSEIDFNEFSDKMPYIVRQGSGGGNSLGRIKFLFPNKFRVYLHDTPSKSLFARESRAFSHGCIRVQYPFELASYILSDQGVTVQYIDSVKQTLKKHRIVLDDPLPVIITYTTAFADPDMVYFYDDIYSRDTPLLKALNL